MPACQISVCFSSIDWTSFSEGDFLYDWFHLCRLLQMAAKPLTDEAIALTEKKMDMSLGVWMSARVLIVLWQEDRGVVSPPLFFFSSFFADEIIKMSKANPMKPKKQRVLVRFPFFIIFVDFGSYHLFCSILFIVLNWTFILVEPRSEVCCQCCSR